MAKKPIESQDPFDRRATSGTTYNPPAEPFKVQSQSSIIKFLREGVQPPSLVYMGLGDQFQLNVSSQQAALTVVVNGRWLRAADGAVVPFTFAFSVPVNRSLNTFTFQLGEGFLLSLVVMTGANTFANTSTYALVSMFRNVSGAGQGFLQLCAGYIGGLKALMWPGGNYTRPQEGPGYMRSIIGSTPAAGAEIQETVPSNARWRLFSIRYTLATSAAVGNRVTSLQFTDGSQVYDEAYSNQAQAASLTIPYTFSNSAIPFNVGVATSINVFAMDDNKFLIGGHVIRTSTGGIQAGDQYTAPRYYVQEWLDLE